MTSKSERTWFEWSLLDIDYLRPLCSELDCPRKANRFIGYYASEDSQQGEHSQFCGWAVCNEHADGLFKRLTRR